MLHWKKNLNQTIFFNLQKEIWFIIINVEVQKSAFRKMKGFDWMFHSPGQILIDFNQFPLAPFAINFYNQQVLWSSQLVPQIFQNRLKVEQLLSKAVKEQENHVSDLNNDLTMQNSIKIQQKDHTHLQIQKTKNYEFNYFDPHQAPHLTFGIENILTKSKSQCSNAHQIYKNCNKFNKKQDFLENSFEICPETSPLTEFVVKQPDPKISPFLIIKKRTLIKKKSLTAQEYEKRAHLIEIRRVKNLQRMNIEERIGKKLPVKNKKWKRKKPSLVFKQYKKKLMTSKKYKAEENNYNQLFFPSS